MHFTLISCVAQTHSTQAESKMYIYFIYLKFTFIIALFLELIYFFELLTLLLLALFLYLFHNSVRLLSAEVLGQF